MRAGVAGLRTLRLKEDEDWDERHILELSSNGGVVGCTVETLVGRDLRITGEAQVLAPAPGPATCDPALEERDRVPPLSELGRRPSPPPPSSPASAESDAMGGPRVRVKHRPC